MLGLVLGVMQILAFALWVTQFFAFLDTKMLVSPTRNCGIGGLKPTQGLNANGFAEYRLKGTALIDSTILPCVVILFK